MVPLTRSTSIVGAAALASRARAEVTNKPKSIRTRMILIILVLLYYQKILIVDVTDWSPVLEGI